MIGATRRGFISGAAGAAVFATTNAVGLPLGGLGLPVPGHVGFAGDHAWWDARGEGPVSRFAALPVSQPLTHEMLDWLV